MIKMHPPSDFLLAGIAQNLEESDIEELTSVTGTDDMLDVLMGSRDASFECYVLCAGPTPVAVFGICMLDPSEGSVGVPWAILSKDMRKYPREIVKIARFVLGRWKAMFPFLTNLVDKRNKRAIKWLKSLGFTMEDTEMSVMGDPFYIFEMRNV